MKKELYEEILHILDVDIASYVHLMSHDRERIAKSIAKRLYVENGEVGIKK